MESSSLPSARHGFRFPAKSLLAVACALLLVLSTLPLYLLSFYNHPYYDDYDFSAKAHDAWQQSHSLPTLLQSALQSAQTVRSNWQGTYTGTLLSNVQPGLFSESLYFLTTFWLLTVFLLCFGFFLKVLLSDLLGLASAEAVILTCLSLTLLIQFMPDPDEAFFWFNGGIGNTFIYSLLALSLALCVKLERCAGQGKQMLLFLVLTLLMGLLGGGSYSGGLLGLPLWAGVTLWAFGRKRPKAWMYGLLTLLFLGGFLYSMAAPGNGVRAAVIANPVSPVKAVGQALYYGVALAGSYVRLPLLAITGLALPFLLAAAQKSPWRFAHPWLWLLAGLCLFCAQLTPPLYSGVFIGGGRTVDTYWQSFVLLWLVYCYYLAGHLLRRMETAGRALSSLSVSLQRGLLLLSAILLVVGCLGYKRPADKTYGLPNLAGVSATLSLLKGEAQQYHREMTAREALLRDPSQPEVTLAPLSAVPDLFMKDLLAADARDDVRPVLCRYYHKTAIHLAGQEVAP